MLSVLYQLNPGTLWFVVLPTVIMIISGLWPLDVDR